MSSPSAAASPVLAAGAVVWRPAHGSDPAPRGGGADGTPGAEVDVLLVHRPKYDDWSLPKGKLDPGEHLLSAAAREVQEETGLAVRLGLPLPQQQYAASPGVTKQVHYWAARPVGESGVSGYEPNHEIDDVVWLSLDDARRRLTYGRDVAVLDAFALSAYRCEPLIVLRHAQALRREAWSGADRERTLAPDGEVQAQALVPLLQAYGVGRVLSSDAVRCTTTVAPYAAAQGLRVEVDHSLSEEGAQGAAVARRVDTLLREGEALVVCSHRPVLPALFAALDVHDPGLPPGGMVVVHRDGTRIRATEHHHV